MSKLEAASLLDAADGLRALFRGEDSDDAELGSLFLAKALSAMIGMG